LTVLKRHLQYLMMLLAEYRGEASQVYGKGEKGVGSQNAADERKNPWKPGFKQPKNTVIGKQKR